MLKFPSPFGSAIFVCTHKRPDGHPKPCCADRGGRELPIQPDFVGMHVAVEDNERVDVHLKEKAGEDEVVLTANA